MDQLSVVGILDNQNPARDGSLYLHRQISFLTMSKKKKFTAITSQNRRIQSARQLFLEKYIDNLRTHLRKNLSATDTEEFVEKLRKRLERERPFPDAIDEGTGPRLPISLYRRSKLVHKRRGAKAFSVSKNISFLSDQTAKEKNLGSINVPIREKSDK